MEDASAVADFDDFPGAFLAVYDGHGGALAARLLEAMLHSYFLDELLADAPVPPVLADRRREELLHREEDPASACSTPAYDDVMQVVDRREHPANTPDLPVKEAFERAYRNMDAMLKVRRCCRTGATAVTCFVRDVPGRGRVLTTANCGDARAVLCRAGRPLRLSVDHRPTEPFERERVERAGAFVTCGRVNGVLNVSRAFGDHSMKSAVVSTPHVGEILLGSMDDFLVIACDGLWDFVEETVVVKIAREAFDRGLDATEVAQVLVETALERKGTDNVTVMVVQLDVDE